MRIDVHVFVHDARDDLLVTLNHKVDNLMLTMAELQTTLESATQKIQTIGTEVTKVSAESTTSLQKIADLTAALANQGNTTPEVDAALAALQDSLTKLATQVQAVDALVPDSTP